MEKEGITVDVRGSSSIYFVTPFACIPEINVNKKINMAIPLLCIIQREMVIYADTITSNAEMVCEAEAEYFLELEFMPTVAVLGTGSF